MSGALEFTILGCGSSGGVPRADGTWGSCDSAEPRNFRTRCSLAVRRRSGSAEAAATTVLVDTSPDFRSQVIKAEIHRIDGLLFTHHHADHTHGIDDLRAFFYGQGKPIRCFGNSATIASLAERFGYAFSGTPTHGAIADIAPVPPAGTAFEVAGPSGPVPIVAYDQDHGDIQSLGFRFGNVGYSSDVVRLPPASLEALRGLDVLIIDALRYIPHPSHAHLALTLDWIDALKPRRAILTNMDTPMDYRTLRRELPAHIEPGYDGMRFEVDL